MVYQQGADEHVVRHHVCIVGAAARARFRATLRVWGWPVISKDTALRTVPPPLRTVPGGVMLSSRTVVGESQGEEGEDAKLAIFLRSVRRSTLKEGVAGAE